MEHLNYCQVAGIYKRALSLYPLLIFFTPDDIFLLNFCKEKFLLTILLLWNLFLYILFDILWQKTIKELRLTFSQWNRLSKFSTYFMGVKSYLQDSEELPTFP